MIARAGWRGKVTAALAVAGVLSLGVALALYLLFNQLDRPGWIFLILGVGLLGFYVSEDYQNVRRALGGRHARYGGNTVAVILIFLAIVGLLNFFSSRHSLRFDLTASGQFTLSDQSLKVLENVKEPVSVTAFFQPGDYGQTDVEDLLKEYRRQNDKVQFDVVDYQVRPADALKLNLQAFPVVVFQVGNRRQDVTSFTQEDFTNALFKVSQGEAKKVYYSTGHGEPDITGMNEPGVGLARQALESSNYQIEAVNLATVPAVAADAAALIIDAPKTMLQPQEKQVVKEYLDRGGKALVLLSARDTADLSDLLAPYGLQYGKGVAIDAGQSLNGQPYMPIVTNFPDASPVTRDLQSMKEAVLLPLSTQISVTQLLPAGVSVNRLLQTTDRSWLATSEQDISYHQGDLRGPLTLGIAATADAKSDGGQEKGKTRLVVFGSADFVTNVVLDAGANRQLLVNAVNWLAEQEDLITIRPEPPVDRTMMLTGTQANLLLYSSVLFLPLLAGLGGAWVWWRRR